MDRQTCGQRDRWVNGLVNGRTDVQVGDEWTGRQTGREMDTMHALGFPVCREYLRGLKLRCCTYGVETLCEGLEKYPENIAYYWSRTNADLH